MTNCDTYKEVHTLEYENGITRIYIPNITAEERDRRMAQISKAAADLLNGTKNRGGGYEA